MYNEIGAVSFRRQRLFSFSNSHQTSADSPWASSAVAV